ncbi:lycopene cyclase domain-containing protein [Pontimonas sp.]|jgi:lycopene cyclase domain-containing protein|uniref:lycopene cyclase domain-containing protein n=1 Tax=Pontimonas sp. TaxID=2304492 RepID=UPI0028709442|nr:lycopene cyclase domain-containing protein [Pontimonas sp.]MDR9396362.1 lycopene cyclase domain-containing protein [Pontimonas sp.]MDR9434960.1 lycopene cyclase domain-containing protein [Pontimonas sp.]
MTYWLINIWFLLAALIIAVVAALWPRLQKGDGRQPGPHFRAMLAALAVVLVLTAVFDNAIIGFGIVDYDPGKISGVRLGVAPLEDFAYTVAAALIVPAVWTMLAKRSGSS